MRKSRPSGGARSLVIVVGTAVLLTISLTHFFIIPTVCCAVIFVGFAAALFGPSSS